MIDTFKIPFQAMAGGCEVVIAMADEPAARALAQQAIDEVHRIEAKFSRYRADSIISRINAAAGQAALACDDETWNLLEYADAIYRASGGLFDISSGVLRRAWDFKAQRVPSAQQLAQVLPLIGWSRIERDAGHIRLPQAGMEIDFGGFGKEYAADRAAAILAQQGVRHGYVSLGGDMRVIGPKPDGSPWMIGIVHPRQKGKMIATIPIEQGGLATSGDYERFFEIDGKRYCHILQPASGQPVTHWRSISVVAPLAVMAGSCTTIAMLKQAEGQDYLASTGMAYLAMDHLGQIVSGQQQRPTTTQPIHP
jgi:thiamine biosynthesis lipoprotein